MDAVYLASILLLLSPLVGFIFFIDKLGGRQ